MGKLRGENPAQTLPAFRMLAEAIEEATADPSLVAFRGLVYNGGFNAAYSAGCFAEALKFAEQEHETAMSLGDSHFAIARSLNNRGLAFLELGELVKAEADFTFALREIAEHGRAGEESSPQRSRASRQKPPANP